MAWVEPEFSRKQVNTAAQYYVEGFYKKSLSSDFFQAFLKLEEATEIIHNWRAAHSYPLNTFQVNLRRTSKRIDTNALVAQRIKRMSSIDLKLRRFPNMKLTQMQDIGGCRAVVNSVSSVRELVEAYLESSIKHELATIDDYISVPRNSGYRGIHLTYRYFSDKPAKAIYNDLKIEMQLRSRFQHAWATAVETVGTFVKQSLKSSIGEEEWLRFFALMGTAIAVREKCPPVPGTPENYNELVTELTHSAEHLDVEARLEAYNHALQYLEQPIAANARYYLLELDTTESAITVTGFTQRELEEASQSYIDAEKRLKDKQGADAVLVSVDSLASLRRAYPNYFADTSVFVKLMRQALSGKHAP